MVLVSLKDLNRNKKMEEDIKKKKKKKQQQKNKTKTGKRKEKNGQGKEKWKEKSFKKVVFICRRFLMICLTQNVPRLSEVLYFFLIQTAIFMHTARCWTLKLVERDSSSQVYLVYSFTFTVLSSM